MGVASPLDAVLVRHRDFFGLLGDFRGYVDHFHLNDFVSDDYRVVIFVKRFDDFAGDPLPSGSLTDHRT